MIEKHKEEIASTLEGMRFHLEIDIGTRGLKLDKLQERQRTDKRKLKEISRLIDNLTKDNQSAR